MARLIGISTSKVSNNTTVYDPTCGSGSLLLKVGEEAAQGKNIKVTLYGQEMETTTAGLARMNMILHDTPTAEIAQGNTLTTPKFTAKKNIRLNTELGKKPKECLEYIVVHELVHLLEPSHNAKFQELMDTHLPNWRALRSQLNSSPLAHSDWKY